MATDFTATINGYYTAVQYRTGPAADLEGLVAHQLIRTGGPEGDRSRAKDATRGVRPEPTARLRAVPQRRRIASILAR